MNDETIHLITSLKPTLTFLKNGDEYTLLRKGGLKEEEPFKFKHLEEVSGKGKNKEIQSRFNL